MVERTVLVIQFSHNKGLHAISESRQRHWRQRVGLPPVAVVLTLRWSDISGVAQPHTGERPVRVKPWI